ncbi:hypothetical protein BXU06_07550 [Aquaspirillum sp. LM1]|uniref:NfeD family protein n=1 Tax=Aquaspirillum sp. LM1 TaxID=1938604 RepID=UPI0009838CB1|nr:NfeD family protein [Aquaspirillum sp. LM1]AQR64936.1 hypothetical protein BXU06_07550 [Aquaspirillum sp. LM1]
MHVPYFWFVLAAFALVIEMIFGTFYLLVAGVAAMLAGLAGVGGYLDLPGQIFLTISLTALGCWQLWQYQLKQQRRPLEALEVIGQTVEVEQWLSPQQARVQWRGAHWDARLAKGQASQNGQATYIISAQEGNLLWIEQFSER